MEMFKNTSITEIEVFLQNSKANTLYCICDSCKQLKRAVIHTAPGGNYSHYGMFRYCSTLEEVTVHFTDWGTSYDSTFNGWLSGVSPTGTFYKPSALPEEIGEAHESRIPTGWTVVNID
jgi:hypothetical protein